MVGLRFLSVVPALGRLRDVVGIDMPGAGNLRQWQQQGQAQPPAWAVAQRLQEVVKAHSDGAS